MMNERMRQMRANVGDASSPLGHLFSSKAHMAEAIENLKNDVASLTEERDFFRSKYAAQGDEIGRLERELRSARNQIAKLREELIAAELERSKGGGSVRSETCPSTEGILSGNDSISREDDRPCGEVDAKDEVDDEDKKCENQDAADATPAASADDEDGSNQGVSGDDDDGSDRSGRSQEDVDAIRDHAAKMLIWANYQSVRQQRQQSSSVGASPAASVQSPEPVPRTIHATGGGDADASVGSLSSRGLFASGAAVDVRASTRSLLGPLAADRGGEESDVDDDDDEVSDYDDGDYDEEGDKDELKSAKSPLDGVRKLLTDKFHEDSDRRPRVFDGVQQDISFPKIAYK